LRVERRGRVGLAGSRTTALEGGPDLGTGRFAPVVITDPDPDSALMQDEIFGPILPVVVTDSLDESIAFVTTRPKPLALYLFTQNSAIENDVLHRTSSGSGTFAERAFRLLLR
jgi:aldehyde dehydrogenase (NAD+)